ncbi:hypothetical protein ABBQ38_009935 [Trebouxia sp. C0009 RCD-2024]
MTKSMGMQHTSSLGRLKRGPISLQRQSKGHKQCRVLPCVVMQQTLRSFQNMQQAYQNLALRLLDASEYKPAERKYIVGIAGAPGSGKSTTAHAVCAKINSMRPRLDKHHVAVVVGMDGFHYTRAQLDEFPDPDEAHARRGAYWTFDGMAFVRKMQEICAEGEAMLPSFDHGVGDPVPNAVQVIPQNKIVLVEGNYLLLDVPPWGQLQKIFDETWYIDCDIDAAMQRVLARQIGHGRSPDVAKWRVQNNDRQNAIMVADTSPRADLLVPSLPEH